MDEDEERDLQALDHARILDSIGDPVLVVSRSFRIVYMNAEARTRFGDVDPGAEPGLCHQLCHGSQRPCFESGVVCPVCSVFETGRTARVVHSHVDCDGAFAPEEIVASPLRDASGRVAFVVECLRQAAELLESKDVIEHMRGELDLLRGVLSTCAGCKRIRNAEGEWVQIEEYVSGHSAAEFSHGICPECVGRLYPGFKGKQQE